LGRRGPVHFLLEDAGLDYELRLHKMENWKELKGEFIASKQMQLAVLPAIELEGKTYVGTLPILRYLSQRLGKYAGKTAEDAYLVDAFSDMVNDWSVAAFRYVFGKDEDHNKRYPNELLPKYLDSAERFLSLNEQGPYLLGEGISYADFIL
ncbi:hypothetical protein THASP1DRAFT_4322, partial [Thamnocephalis sphaerospora]